MQQKKFYIPIGILILAICGVGLFSLRSDTPKEPIMIYKVVEPAKQSETQTATATRDTADENLFHAEQPPPSTGQVSKNHPTEGNTEASETIAFGGDIAAETPRLSKEEFEEKFKEELAEQRYNIAAAEYFKDFQEYHKQFQAFQSESAELTKEVEDIGKLRSKASTMSDAELDEVLNRIEKLREQESDLQRRKAAWRKVHPTPPTPPVRK